jgi:hypothetical protein
MTDRGGKLDKVDLYVNYTPGEAQGVFDESFMPSLEKHLDGVKFELHVEQGHVK